MHIISTSLRGGFVTNTATVGGRDPDPLHNMVVLDVAYPGDKA
ncbi:hypothetical protein [Burkholderia sp. PAMC 26561]|nr:hypothetical protein [Burkholderia sp. PAMC 26561]